MAKEKQNMDNFLRDSLGNLEMAPSKNVWKGVSKKLILLELIRLNFSNIGKSWLYTGVAAVTAFAGFTIYQMNQEDSPSETPKTTEVIIASNTEEVKADQKETYQLTEDEVNSSAETEIITELEPIDEIDKEQDITKASIIRKKSKVQNKEIEPNPVTDISAPVSNIEPKENESNSTDDIDENKAESIDNISDENSNSTTEYGLTTTPVAQEKTATQNTKEENTKSEPAPANKEELNSETSSKHQKIIAPVITDDEIKDLADEEPTNLTWFVGANYTPEWPISSEEMYVNNHQLGVKAGIEYKKWSMSIGIGVKTEKTPSRFMAHYSTYDSVGFFYDIDYYEQAPNSSDSIIIHYTIRSLFDSIDNQSEVQGPDQKRRWIFIPIDFSYRLYRKPKYELMAKVSANLGWSNYTESNNMSSALAGYYQLENITIKHNDTYLQVGIGLENNFSILPNWWIYAEPRLNYYVKSPYEIKGNSNNGPFAFGLQIGIKYKFNR
ncbi:MULTISPECIES: hypothetical protein [unclassified Lentimicrobium]|uniref:hypothetical protein n=1 Tax=unclassified Lentimicrobium TaxID=2677434 RepID=UPI001554DD57|nr:MULTISPECIES: hypothetical protein [unclassified Lentimicrobium]NPD44495.1 hypothetical protein [Lentimicrobium sp. S6]NPD84205.1 hypothetical protein [Lentimicrobium sp. L6]